MTKRMMEMLRRVKAVFSLVDSFIPKQRITGNMLVTFPPFEMCKSCLLDRSAVIPKEKKST